MVENKPINSKIYLDNNATTPLSDGVKRIIMHSLDAFYNPSGVYSNHNKPVVALIETARRRVAALIGLNSKEARHIVFNSGATEGNNAVFSFLLNCSTEKRKHVIVSSVEHVAVLEAAKMYCKAFNASLDILPVDGMGRISAEMLSNAIRPETTLVSIMLANNELGNVYDIAKLSAAVHSANPAICFHTDATQAIGKMPINVEQLDVDFLTLSGHKFHAPKGIGALYVKNIDSYTPFLFGGHQESGYRPGTENTLGIVALGQAALEMSRLDGASYQRVAALRDKMERRLVSAIPGAVVLGDTDNRICNTSCTLLPKVEGYSICISLDEKGICVSSGSACSGKELKPSHVMNAISIEHSPIRVSLSSHTTEAEIDYFIDTLVDVYLKSWHYDH